MKSFINHLLKKPNKVEKGIVIDLYGSNVIAWFTEKGIKLHPASRTIVTVGFKCLTPKKLYSKYEKETISKLVIDEYCFTVKYFGEHGINATIEMIINKVRPGTLSSKEDIQTNRYYKIV